MKKFTFILAIMLLTHSIFATDFKKHFNFEQIKTSEKGGYTVLEIEQAMNTALKGQPMVPWFVAKILLPQGEEIKSYHFEGKNLATVEGSFHLAPMQPSRPISTGNSKEGLIIDQKSYASDAAYPSINYRNGGTHFQGGYSIGYVYYTPFVYHPKSGRLYYYKDIEINIETKSTTRAQEAAKLLRHDVSLQKSIKKYVSNPNILDTYNTRSTSNASDNYEMLIVTPEAFTAAFEDLTSLYLKQGIRAHIESIENIESNGTGLDLQEKIRNYAKEAYMNNGLQYLLLGGDVEHVPYRGFYCHVQSSQVYEDDNIPSDLYFSALDGTWNDDEDDKWGEIGEDDLLPEIAVARLPFSTEQDLQNMLNKTIKYQSEPVLGKLNHPLMAGEKLWDDPVTYGSDYMELLFGHREDNGYITDGIPETNPATKLYDKNASWSPADLMNEVSSGHNFLFHSGHANYNTVMKLYTGDVTDANFSGANGVDNMFTNVYTHGCICGSFDNDDCIAEHMLKIQNFAASFIGNSRYGWFNEGQTEGPSQHLHREYVNALYHDSIYRIGATHAASRTETAEWVNAPGQHEEGALRWCFYDCNVLGDPAMPLWTEELKDFIAEHTGTMTVGQTQYEVLVYHQDDDSPIGNANVHIEKDGVLYAQGTTDATGHVVLTMDPVLTATGEVKLWVSAYNHLPKEETITVVPAEGPYVYIAEFDMTDAQGNFPYPPGNKIFTQLILKNAGSTIATNTQVSLTCNSPYITVLQGTANCGNIVAGANYDVNNTLQIHFANDIPYGESYTLAFHITADNYDNTFYISRFFSAPLLRTQSMWIDDSNGNNNGRLDAGEEVQIHFNIKNHGDYTSLEGEAELTNPTDNLDITTSTITLPSIQYNQETSVTFDAHVPDNANVGDAVQLILELHHGDYNTSATCNLTIGEDIEDWESNSFDTYEWITDNAHPWIIQDTIVYEGTYTAQSAPIEGGNTSALSLHLHTMHNDSVSFYAKVSSESSYDFLKFYINGEVMEEWSGEMDWSKQTFAVPAGNNTLKWTYEKDQFMNQGMDRAFIDYIVLPLMGNIDGIQEQAKDMTIKFYPNPVNKTAVLNFKSDINGTVEYQIYDINGHSVSTTYIFVQQGQNTQSIQVEQLQAGEYVIVLRHNGKIWARTPFIKL